MLFRLSGVLLAWFWASSLIVASDQGLRGLAALIAAARESEGYGKTPSYTDLVKKGYGAMVSAHKKTPSTSVECFTCSQGVEAPYFIKHMVWEHRAKMEKFLDESPEFNSWRESLVYIGMCNNADLEKRH